MADERLTDRTTLTEFADGDLIHVVDVSDTTDNPLGTSKKGLWSLFKSTLKTYFDTLYTSIDDGVESYSRRKAVIDLVDNTVAPPTEVSGDRYILDFTGSSHANWDGAAAGSIVEFNGTTWIATTPIEGWIAYVDAENKDALYVDDGSPEWQLRSVGAGNEVLETDFNANTILAADTDDTPTARTIAESQIVGRLTGGNIKGLSVSEIKTLLGIINQYHEFACSDETSDLETGTVYEQRLLKALNGCTSFDFSVITAPIGSTIIIDVQKNGTTVFSTKPTIDASEFSTLTASTPQVISGGSVSFAAGDVLKVVIDQVGSKVAGVNMKAQLTHNT